MSAVFNPSVATITAPNVARDHVTAFHLVAKRSESVAATADAPVPAPNADGTYTVSLDTLKAGIDAQFYGDALNLYASCVAAGGTSEAVVNPDGFIYQPVPSAPTAVALS